MAEKLRHKEYLERQLYSKKLERNELETQDRIHRAVTDAKRDMLVNQINSLERQLEEGVD